MDIKTARQFRRIVNDAGYRTFHLAFGDGNHRVADWERHLPRLEDPLRGLVELFLLRRMLDARRVRALLGDEVTTALVAEQILVEAGGDIWSDRLLLICFRSILFFHEIERDPRVYFGSDSIALGLYQTPTPGGVSLDLCSGSAIQAMIAAQHGRKAYACEINPRAAAVARVNVALNGLEDKVEVINRSLEDYAAEVKEPLDLVTFNPPLLPVPGLLRYPFVGDGGGDALDVSRRALQLYLPRLAPGGAIEFIGCGLGRDGEPTFVDDVTAIMSEHGARTHAHLLGHALLQRGDQFYDSIVHTAALNTPEVPLEGCFEIFDLHFAKLGYTDIWLFFVRGLRDAEVVAAARPPTPAQITDIAESASWFA